LGRCSVTQVGFELGVVVKCTVLGVDVSVAVFMDVTSTWVAGELGVITATVFMGDKETSEKWFALLGYARHRQRWMRTALLRASWNMLLQVTMV
jgi:hypothetical protein